MSNGRREAAVAARWWADRLAGDDDIRTGDAMNETFALFVRSRQPKPSPEQVEIFRSALEQALIEGPAASDAWRRAVETGEPRLGSALRCFGVDYGPDPILADALEAAGIDSRRTMVLPLKTAMWFNPGVVSVGLGYNAPAVELPLDPA